MTPLQWVSEPPASILLGLGGLHAGFFAPDAVSSVYTYTTDTSDFSIRSAWHMNCLRSAGRFYGALDKSGTLALLVGMLLRL